MMYLPKMILLMMFVHFILPPMTGAEEIVKAKVGVEIVQMGKGTNNIRKARAINDLTGDEMLTVVVNPEEDSFVYIINSNEQESVLLNRSPEEQFIKKAQKRFFPNPGQLYKPDITGNKESLTIVVSPNKNTEIKKLFASGTASQEQWGALEKELVQTSSLLGEDEFEKRKEFGGTVRGLDSTVIKHSTYAGKGLIIKTYQFNVKN